MAILKQGILGHITGKTGPITSYLRYGQNITRSIGTCKKNKIETEDRKKQRDKIKLCNGFTKVFTGTGFFNKSFPANGAVNSGYNRATSAIMNQAILTQPEPAISYPRILISQGAIPPVEYAAALPDPEGNILFSWTDNSGIGTAKKTDTAILVAFFPETKTVVTEFSKATRENGKAVLKMESEEGIAETWLGFLSADEKNATNSVYTGSIKI